MSEKTEHSPLPWSKDVKCQIGPRFETDDQSDGMLDDVACTYGEKREANAALIVRAVNNHAKLVEALEDIVKHMDHHGMSHWQAAKIAREAIAEMQQEPKS